MKFKIAKSLQEDYVSLLLYETVINSNIRAFDTEFLFPRANVSSNFHRNEREIGSGENSSSDYGIGGTAPPIHVGDSRRWRKQALGNQAYLVHVSSRIESRRSSYSRRSNGQGKRERKEDRDRDLSEQRARTLRHVAAGGTTSGYRKCQKAQSSTALFYLSFLPSRFLPLSHSRSHSLRLSLSLCQRIDRNLATRRCTPRGICGEERQLHRSAYFISARPPIYLRAEKLNFSHRRREA